MNTIGQSWYERGKSMLRATFKMKGIDACKVEGTDGVRTYLNKSAMDMVGGDLGAAKGWKGKVYDLVSREYLN